MKYSVDYYTRKGFRFGSVNIEANNADDAIVQANLDDPNIGHICNVSKIELKREKGFNQLSHNKLVVELNDNPEPRKVWDLEARLAKLEKKKVKIQKKVQDNKVAGHRCEVMSANMKTPYELAQNLCNLGNAYYQAAEHQEELLRWCEYDIDMLSVGGVEAYNIMAFKRRFKWNPLIIKGNDPRYIKYQEELEAVRKQKQEEQLKAQQAKQMMADINLLSKAIEGASV